MPRPIVVDDSDGLIRYSGSGWASRSTDEVDDVGTFGPTYKHTLHSTEKNDSLAFSFKGKSVKVFGTAKLEPTYAMDSSFVPPWECFIDQHSIDWSKPQRYYENNQLLCQDEMAEGQHELTLQIDMKPGTVFWIDYIVYIPTQDPVDQAVVIVEQSDADFEYDSNWHDGEARMTNTYGSSVKLRFTGIQLTWIGTIPIDLPRGESSASYSIDNGPSTSFRLVGLGLHDGTSKYNQLFFTTPQLEPGDHTIVVKYDGNPQLTPLTVAHVYLSVTAPRNPTSNGVSPPSRAAFVTATSVSSPNSSLPSPLSLSSSSALERSPTTIPPGLSSGTAPWGSASSPSSNSPGHQTWTTTSLITETLHPNKTGTVPIGTLVGSLVGGLAFIAIVIVLIIYLLRTRRRKNGQVVPFRFSGTDKHSNDPDSDDIRVTTKERLLVLQLSGSSKTSRPASLALRSPGISSGSVEGDNTIMSISNIPKYDSGASAQTGDHGRKGRPAGPRGDVHLELNSIDPPTDEDPPRYSARP